MNLFIYVNELRSKSKRTARKRDRTSGSGHNGSFNLAISAGFNTSMSTSWETLARRVPPGTPNAPRPPPPSSRAISKESTACACFFASFMTTSVEFAAERRAWRSASGERLRLISLFALDWMR